MGLKSYTSSDIQIVAYAIVFEDEDHGMHVEYEIENKELWDAGGRDHKGYDRCECCGHRLKYSCIVYSESENRFFSVGRMCTSKIENLKGMVTRGMDDASIAILERNRCNKREEHFLQDNPGCKKLIEEMKSSTIPFVKELYGKLRRYGTLSERQLEAVEKVMHEENERRSKATGKALEGKHEVIGYVLSFKDVINSFTGEEQTKMVVDLGNGVRVYGTKPRAFPRNLGFIKFKATFKPSDRDPLFGFFTRPSLVDIG